MIDRAKIEAARLENLAKRRVAQIARRAGKPITPAKAAQLAKLERQRRETEDQARRFKLLCKASGLPIPSREIRFHQTRDWRFDFAFDAERVAVEVEGGIWTQGRHTRGSGYERDMIKYNCAGLAGWLVLRVTPGELCSVETVDMVRLALLARAAGRP
jgi:very-short-patch-repair endonuclease